MPLGKEEIAHRFGPHPATAVTAKMYEQVVGAYIAFAEFLDTVLPDSRAKSTAFTNLQNSSMSANYSIAELAPVAQPTSSTPIIRPSARPTPPAGKGSVV